MRIFGPPSHVFVAQRIPHGLQFYLLRRYQSRLHPKDPEVVGIRPTPHSGNRCHIAPNELRTF